MPPALRRNGLSGVTQFVDRLLNERSALTRIAVQLRLRDAVLAPWSRCGTADGKMSCPVSTSIASCVSSNAVCKRLSCSLRGLLLVVEDFLQLARWRTSMFWSVFTPRMKSAIWSICGRLKLKRAAARVGR